MNGRTTKGIEIRKMQRNARRTGFTNGLTHGYTNGLTNGLSGKGMRAHGSEKKHGKILALAVLGFLVLGVFAVLTYQNQQRNTIAIDGNFDDWQGVAKQSKERTTNVPENIDIAEYASTETGKNVAFYAKVFGNMLYGDGRYIVEVPNENPVYVAEIREKAIPNANGRDVAYVFIDTDNNANTGFKPSDKFVVGADKAIEIFGKNGKIEASRVLEFAGTVPYEWNWVVKQSVDAATNGKQMETMASKSVLGIGEKYAVYFYMVDWQGKECKLGSALKFDGSVVSNIGILSGHAHYVPLTAYHTIWVDGYLGDWQSDENMGGRDYVTWYLTWDNTTLYVGVDRGENFHYNSTNYDVMWIYLDTIPGGGNQSVNWNGRHTLPFDADMCFLYCPYQSYWDLRRWDAGLGDWNASQYYTGRVRINDTLHGAEMSIPFANIGYPSALNITFYFTNGYNNWLFGASPKENPTGASPQTLTGYWIETSLTNGNAPNTAKKHIPPLTIASNTDLSSYATSWGWAGNGTESNPYVIENYSIDGRNVSSTVLSISNTDSYVIIRNNNITNATGSGLLLTSTTHINVTLNYIKYCTFGISLDTATYIGIHDNNISENAQNGIKLTYGSSANITYNNFMSNTYHAIYITQGCTGCRIEHNNLWNNNGTTRGAVGGSQVYDENTENTWGGNYYSNYDNSTTETYPIAGAGIEETTPSTTPNPTTTPEASYAILLVLPLLVILARRKIRRQ